MTDQPRDAFDSGNDPAPEAIDRMAAPLRAAVALDEDFERRVMHSVREVGSHKAPNAPSRDGYALRLTPVSGLALAASLALAAVLGRLSAHPTRSNENPPSAVASAAVHDTIYIVRFALIDPDARQVSLVGDFNGWTRGATPLTGQGTDGVWSAFIPVTPGRHEYAFIVDGREWVADPYAATVRDEFGTSSSVLHIGDGRHGPESAPPAI